MSDELILSLGPLVEIRSHKIWHDAMVWRHHSNGVVMPDRESCLSLAVLFDG